MLHTITHTLGVVFGWPDGIVTGNLLASLICLACAFILRDRLMKKFVAFHHKHKTAHAAKLAGEGKDNA